MESNEIHKAKTTTKTKKEIIKTTKIINSGQAHAKITKTKAETYKSNNNNNNSSKKKLINVCCQQFK